jgi:hypothetical protein
MPIRLRYLLLALVCIIPSVCWAQRIAAVELGFNVGPQLGWIYNENRPTKTPQAGFNAGVRLGMKIINTIGLEIQPGISTQGQPGFIREQDTTGQRVNIRSTFFRLPLYVTVNTNPDRKGQFYGFMGFFVQALMSQQIQVDKGGALLAENKRQLDKSHLLNYGVSWGVGGKLRVWKNLLWSAELRTDVALRRFAPNIDGFHMNLALMTGLAWLFPMKAKVDKGKRGKDND